jgi:hypothetical protein
MRSLDIGEVAKNIPVFARLRWNSTGLLIRPAEQYLVTATEELWTDWCISSTAAGQPGVGIQKLFRSFVRFRTAQWFQLVAAVGRSHDQLFDVGMAGRVTLGDGHEGELLFFANDVSLAYFNNSGQIHVDVLREH